MVSSPTWRKRSLIGSPSNDHPSPFVLANLPSQSLDPDVRLCNTRSMKQSIGLVSLVVPDYEDAIAFYVGVLGFKVIEDSGVPKQGKRWVVVAPEGAKEAGLLLARATTQEQRSRIGNQTGGRVFLFLHTDHFDRDYDAFKSKGVVFVREPEQQPYGKVAVFQDPWGNLWDLLEPSASDADNDDA